MSTVNLLGERTLNGLFYAPPSDLIDDDEVQDYLVFMITGNPGLISYYEPFLSTLHNLLTSSFDSSSSRFYVCGHSLAGFDTSKSDDAENLVLPAGLFQQISNTEKLLYQQIDRLQKATSMKERPLKVILMGHSVGAYILLELISNHRLRVEEGQKDFDLIGGILLFPTITHLAQSPQGMIYSVSLYHVIFRSLVPIRIYLAGTWLMRVESSSDPSFCSYRWRFCQIPIRTSPDNGPCQYHQAVYAISRACGEDDS